MFQAKFLEEVKTHILCSVTFLFTKNRVVYEIMSKNPCTAGQATDDNTTRRTHIPCWITKATYTHSEYVILLFNGNGVRRNAPECDVMRSLPVFSLKLKGPCGKCETARPVTRCDILEDMNPL